MSSFPENGSFNYVYAKSKVLKFKSATKIRANIKSTKIYKKYKLPSYNKFVSKANKLYYQI